MPDPRTALVALLEEHQPADEKEAADLARMKGYARALAAPFSRNERVAHFTASAILVSADSKSTGLVHHRKLDRWLQPGGHFEPEDLGDVQTAALREVAEETGCSAQLLPGARIPFDVDIHDIPVRGVEPAHQHLDLRLLVRAVQDTLGLNPVEAHEVQWLTWQLALDRADDPSLQRALRKAVRWLTGQDQPARRADN